MINIILFIALGLVAGVLSGLLGIGGGIIIVPALMFICGFSQLKAQGTSLAILLPPAGAVAFIEYYKNGNVDVKAGIIICCFLIVGSFFGAKLASYIPLNVLRRTFGVLMLLISVKLIIGK